MTEHEVPSVDGLVIAILGGTGEQGRGLARRFALAGNMVLTGAVLTGTSSPLAAGTCVMLVCEWVKPSAWPSSCRVTASSSAGAHGCLLLRITRPARPRRESRRRR